MTMNTDSAIPVWLRVVSRRAVARLGLVRTFLGGVAAGRRSPGGEVENGTPLLRARVPEVISAGK